MDRSSKYIQEAELLAWSLVRLANVRPDQVVLHTPNGASALHLPLAASLGVRVVQVPVWEDLYPDFQGRPHYNKIVQLLHGKLDPADDVVLLDCDIVASRPVKFGFAGVAAKPADVGAINLDVLRAVFERARVKLRLGRSELDNSLIPRSWMNTGVVAVEAEHRMTFGTAWAEWAIWLARSVPETEVPIGLADEIAFALAVESEGLPVRNLGPKWNFVVNKGRRFWKDCDPVLIHYRGHFANNGVLRAVPNHGPLGAAPRANRRIAKINESLRVYYRELDSVSS